MKGKLAEVLVGLAAFQRLRSGDRGVTLPLEERALAIRRELLPLNPDRDAAEHALAISLNNVALESPDADQNRKRLQEVVRIREQLVKRQPGNVGFRENLAKCYHNWGYSLSWSQQPAEGLQYHQKAMELHEQLAREQPASAAAHLSFARSHHHLANAYADGLKQLAAAHEHRQKSVEILEAFLQRQPQWASAKSGLATFHGELALIRDKLGLQDQAVESYRAAIRTKAALAAEYPELVEYQVSLAGSESNFGSYLEAHGDREAALEQLQTARQRLAKVIGTTGGHAKAQEFWRITLTHLARIHRTRAGALSMQGDADAALTAMMAEHEVRQEVVASNSSNPMYAVELGGTQCNLGNLHVTAGRHEQALEWYARAIDTLRTRRLAATNQSPAHPRPWTRPCGASWKSCQPRHLAAASGARSLRDPAHGLRRAAVCPRAEPQRSAAT